MATGTLNYGTWAPPSYCHPYYENSETGEVAHAALRFKDCVITPILVDVVDAETGIEEGTALCYAVVWAVLSHDTWSWTLETEVQLYDGTGTVLAFGLDTSAEPDTWGLPYEPPNSEDIINFRKGQTLTADWDVTYDWSGSSVGQGILLPFQQFAIDSTVGFAGTDSIGNIRCDRLGPISGWGCIYGTNIPTLIMDSGDPEYGLSAQFVYVRNSPCPIILVGMRDLDRRYIG